MRWRDLLSPRVRFARHFGCVHKALRRHVLVDRCRLSRSSEAQTHTLQILCWCYGGTEFDAWQQAEDLIWNKLEKELDCVCICMRVCGLRVHMCASTVSLCVHIYAHAWVCTCPCAWARRQNRRLECVSVWKHFEVMWCLCTTRLPPPCPSPSLPPVLLFVLITERFT